MPAKTDEDFFEGDGKRWFKTGDIGEVHDDGVVTIIGKFFKKISLFYYIVTCKVWHKVSVT